VAANSCAICGVASWLLLLTMMTSTGYDWAATNRSTCSRLIGRRLASLYAGMMMDSSGGASMFDPHESRALSGAAHVRLEYRDRCDSSIGSGQAMMGPAN
jgi:hypothetical protein